ncbi:DUF3237 domain-containing protein [Rhizobium jaguaris]|uniref:DUF3237 domain-containing protein n=1 Tax=Rhizobium jaguaris TaxID=1312183 RepID=UPI0039BF13E0
MSSAIFIPKPLKSLRVEPLFAVEMNITAAQKVGAEAGPSMVGIVGGGRFEGERLKGRVLEGGSDWQQVLADGTVRLDCRVVLETDDGALIGMTYQGVRAGPAEVLARLAQGAPVEADEYYFRINPIFQTRSDDYGWLNRIVAVGTGYRPPTGPVYNIFQVL